MNNKFVKNAKKGVFAGVATLMVAGGALTTATSAFADTTPNNTQSANIQMNASNNGEAAIANANNYLGTPYVYGGLSHSGIDCSGLTMLAFDGAGLTHNAAGQYGQVTPVANGQRGDLVFFENASGIYHVGIVTGADSMIDAQNNGVKYDTISTFAPGDTILYGHVGGSVTPQNYSLAAAPKPQTNNNGNYAASQRNGNVQANDQKAGNDQSDTNSQSDVNNQKTDNKQQNDTNKQNVDNNNDANKDAANKQASNVKDNGKTLPQTGQSNTAATSVLGMIMLSVLGFFGLKRRNANK